MDTEDEQWTDPVPQQTMAAQCFHSNGQTVTAKRQPGFCQSTVSAIVTEFSLYQTCYNESTRQICPNINHRVISQPSLEYLAMYLESTFMVLKHNLHKYTLVWQISLFILKLYGVYMIWNKQTKSSCLLWLHHTITWKRVTRHSLAKITQSPNSTQDCDIIWLVVLGPQGDGGGQCKTVTHSEWNRSRNLPHHLFHVLIWMEGWGRISHDRTDKWQITGVRNVSHLKLGVQVSIRGHHVLILLLARGFDEDLFGLPEFLLHPSHDWAVLAKQGPAATQHVPPKTVGPQWVVPGYRSHTWMTYVWLTMKWIHTRPSLDSTVFDL